MEVYEECVVQWKLGGIANCEKAKNGGLFMNFSKALVFAAVMTMRDMKMEKEKKLIKTQKFYQECYEKIAEDSQQAFSVVCKVVEKASRRYIPEEIKDGSIYLALYAFSLVIEQQGRIHSKQNKIVKIFFDNIDYSFSKEAFLNSAIMGTEVGNFRKVISITKNCAGSFWVTFFRALYKSGTQEDLQEIVDYMVSIIMRFSFLGSSNNITKDICSNFVDSANYQINHVSEISWNEIDWFGVIPIPDRLEKIRNLYEGLVDDTDITDEISKTDLMSMLEYLLLNCICDVVMMIKQPESIKRQMLNEAVAFVGIHPEVNPEQYVKEIKNDTEIGRSYKEMFSSNPLGSVWSIIFTMGGKTDRKDDAIAITVSIFSILLQVENKFVEKYHFLGKENIVQDYNLRIIKQLAEEFA